MKSIGIYIIKVHLQSRLVNDINHTYFARYNFWSLIRIKMIFALQTSFLNPSPQLKLTINDTDTP